DDEHRPAHAAIVANQLAARIVASRNRGAANPVPAAVHVCGPPRGRRTARFLASSTRPRPEGADTSTRLTHLAAILAALAATLVTALPALAAGGGSPSYTPRELADLKAFSAMTFAEKQAYLASLDPSEATAGTSFHWRDAGIGAGTVLVVAIAAGAA